MTAPVDVPDSMLLPTVSVYADGVWVADGRDPDSDQPQALDGLVIRWGRSTVVDQPQPSTCSLTLIDRAGGTRFLELVQLGGRLDVRADALLTVMPEPGTGQLIIDEGFEAGTGNAYLSPAAAGRMARVGGGSAGAWSLAVDATTDAAVGVIVPPGPREPVGGNPAAWDGIPRSAGGETWVASVDVKLPAVFAGWTGWDAELIPVTFDTPWAAAQQLDPLTGRTAQAGGWVRLSGSFVPPPNRWLGVLVRFWPSTGPAWDDLDATTWDDLPGASGVLTNLVTNPAPASASWWATNDGTKYTHAYAAGEVQVTRTATGDPNVAASLLALGNGTYNPVLTAGVTYQRSVDIWVDQAGTVAPTLSAGAWVGGQSLPANTWTRVTETFTGSGVAQYVMCLGVRIPGVGPGTHVKLRRAQLVAVPADGQPVPYFDGSTPDTPAIDYAWTGTANASTSTATGIGTATTWDDLGRLLVDRVQLAAPDAGTLRQAMVFSGRITDMEARYDHAEQATLVDVTAADQRAELGSRDVGDVAWTEETIGARFARIVAASGQPIESRVSATAAALMVSWRDVDRQPAIVLLSELATSADGVLWAATHPTTGPYLELESLSDRPPMWLLEQGPDLVVRIHPQDPEDVGGVVIDACDVLLDPVRWRHDIEDMATRVAVTWREQTTSEGQPAPTDRTITVQNDGLETTIGVHRIAVSTQLSRQADAAVVADSVMGRTANIQWRIGGLTWRADTTDQLDSDALARMMTLLDGTTRNGLPIMLTNLPDWSPVPADESVPLYLEGGVYTSDSGGWDLSLVTSSAAAQGAAAVRWDDLPAPSVLSGRNAAVNPRALATGENAWSTSASYGTAGAGTMSYLTGTAPAAAGQVTSCRRKTWTTAASGGTGVGFLIRRDAANAYDATPGEQVTASCYVRHTTGSRTYAMRVRFLNQVVISGSSQVGADALGPNTAVPGGTGWVRLSCTFTVPAGALGFLLYPETVAASTWAVADTQDATAALVERAAAASAWFDGDTPDVPGVTDYAWTGTANASASTRTDLSVGWQWDQFDPAITWADLNGVALA